MSEVAGSTNEEPPTSSSLSTSRAGKTDTRNFPRESNDSMPSGPSLREASEEVVMEGHHAGSEAASSSAPQPPNANNRGSSVDRLVEMILKECPKLDRLCQESFTMQLSRSRDGEAEEKDGKPEALADYKNSLLTSTPSPQSLARQIVCTTVEVILQSEKIFSQLLEIEEKEASMTARRNMRQKHLPQKNKQNPRIKLGSSEIIPIKSVSFSSISAPLIPSDDDDEDEERAGDIDAIFNSTDDEIAHIQPSEGSNTLRPARPSIRTSPEGQAPSTIALSADSSSRRIARSASPSIRYSNVKQKMHSPTQESAAATTPTTAASSSSYPTVHFSAINPNPQLVLGSSSTQHDGEPYMPTVRFTVDRSVSWEDDQLLASSGGGGGGSRASRSGLSSPSIEPALSPPRSRSRSPLHIHFNDLATETITEAAARLRDSERAGHPRVVHFSAMKDVTVVHTEDAAADLFTTTPLLAATETLSNSSALHQQGAAPSASKIRFRPITGPGIRSSTGGSHAVSSGMHHEAAEISAVAERFRRLIRRAEQVDNITLEAAFEHFDQDHSGTITPLDLQRGLRGLGDTFHFSLEECSALLACLVGKKDLAPPAGINLLGFYRAMGRRSPPPEISTDRDDDETNSTASQRRRPQEEVVSLLASSPIVHAHDAATRLRDIVLEAEQNDRMPIESVFRLFDPTGTGYISALNFRLGLQEFGRKRGEEQSEDAFALINDEDCEELVALFDTNNDGLVSLLEFYRFMGRRSPPPFSATNSGEDLEAELEMQGSDQE